MALEEATGQDWNPFFNQWYFRGGHPKLKVRYQFDDVRRLVTAKVTQSNALPYRMRLKSAVINGNNLRNVDWELTGKADSFSYVYASDARPVIVPDVDHVLVGDLDDEKTPAELLTQYRYTNDHISKRLALLAIDPELRSDKESEDVLRAGLDDRDPVLRRIALQQLRIASKTHAWATSLLPRAIQLATTDTVADTRSAAIAVVARWAPVANRNVFEQAVADSSYYVEAAGLRGLRIVDSAAAYDAARRLLLAGTRSEALSEALTQVSSKGRSEDLAVLLSGYSNRYGVRRFPYVSALARYAALVPDTVVYGQTTQLLREWYVTEPLTNYRETHLGYWRVMVQELADNKNLTTGERSRRMRNLSTMLTGQKQGEESKDALQSMDALIRKLGE
jgi:aminopeptidase N